MKFTMIHYNINVTDLEKSQAFYSEALGLKEARRINAPDNTFVIVYLEDDTHSFQLELTWLRDHEGTYNLGDEEFHLAFRTDDFQAAHAKHEAMGCIKYENPDMGIYFITDPDGYWLEVVPLRLK